MRWRDLADPVARRIPAGPRDGIDIGVEQEWRLRIDGAPVDFRQSVRSVTSDLAHRDPGDPNAVRLPSGVGLTADGWEAELITPPIPARTRCARTGRRPAGRRSRRPVQAAPAARVRAGILRLLDPRQRHLSGSPGRPGGAAAGPALLAGGGAPARVDATRTACWCDHGVAGSRSVRTISTGRCSRSHSRPCRRSRCCARPRPAAAVPAARRSVRALPELDLAIVPARERFGHYVDRRAAGTDLYTAGRAAVLRTSTGSTVTAGDHLAAVWQLARPHARRLGLDPAPVDDAVAGPVQAAVRGRSGIRCPGRGEFPRPAASAGAAGDPGSAADDAGRSGSSKPHG